MPPNPEDHDGKVNSRSLPPTKVDTTKSETHASLDLVQANIAGKSSFKGIDPLHRSCQKLTRQPSPTLYII